MSNDNNIKISSDSNSAPVLVAGARTASEHSKRSSDDLCNFILQPTFKVCGTNDFFDCSEEILETNINNAISDDGIADIFAKKDESETEWRNAFRGLLDAKYSLVLSTCSFTTDSTSKSEKVPKALDALLPSLLFDEVSDGDTRTTKRMKGVEHSLLTKTTSIPDLVVLHSSTENIRVGEFKNASTYKTNHGANQCLAYLNCVLSYYRSVCHIPVESVYGFVYCGDKCKNVEKGKYTIGLIKLSTPKIIGTLFTCQVYWRCFSSDDTFGIKFLLYYLTNGKPYNVSVQHHFPEKKIPGLVHTPVKYWTDKEPSNDSGVLRKLQLNGTSAIVFKVNYIGLMGLLDDLKEIFQESGRLFFFDKFYKECESLRQNKTTSTTTANIGNESSAGLHSADEDGERHFYLKLRVVDTTPCFSEIKNTLKDIFRYSSTNNMVWQYMKDLYVVHPYSNGNFACIVMTDRGKRLEDTKHDAAYMKIMLRDLRAFMYKMIEEGIFHSDFLQHNFVYNDAIKRIKVIDFDEASIDGSAPFRVWQGEDTEEKNWISVLRYPNVLREKIMEYTEVQFIAFVLQLLQPAKDYFVGQNELRDHEHLEQLAYKTYTLLKPCQSERDKYEINIVTLKPIIEEMNQCLTTFLTIAEDGREIPESDPKRKY